MTRIDKQWRAASLLLLLVVGTCINNSLAQSSSNQLVPLSPISTEVPITPDAVKSPRFSIQPATQIDAAEWYAGKSHHSLSLRRQVPTSCK